MRAITTDAGANLAAVNYYFQSKDALIQAVFSRRFRPLNQRRLEMLDAIEAETGGGPLPLEGVLRALLEPPVRMVADLREEGRNFARLIGRVYAEPGDLFARMVHEQFGEVKARFVVAFRRALPGLPDVELFWRFQFLIGAMAHTMARLDHIQVISDGLCDPNDMDGMLERLIAFAVAGFRAPVAAPKGEPACSKK